MSSSPSDKKCPTDPVPIIAGTDGAFLELPLAFVALGILGVGFCCWRFDLDLIPSGAGLSLVATGPAKPATARANPDRSATDSVASVAPGVLRCFIVVPMRLLVLGAGFGGLELTTRLSDTFGDDVDVVLIDQNDAFVFGFSKLDVMFGRSQPAAVRHLYRDFMKPGARFVQSTIRSIDPVAKRVETDAGSFDADLLVVALGADLDPSATPGLVEGGHEFYTVAGAFALRDVLANFAGGRVPSWRSRRRRSSVRLPRARPRS